MRFTSIRLENYGLHRSRSLELPDVPGAGLTVIHGPNERGKSTCLAAITDFLFGIAHTSPYGQVYGYEMMKIIATLRLANGKALTLQRRKGKGSGRTLLDADGKAADESPLAGALGAITRQRFESLFGL